MKLTIRQYYDLLKQAVNGYYQNEIGVGFPSDAPGLEAERDALLERLREEKRVALLVEKASKRAARKYPAMRTEPATLRHESG